MRSAAVAAAAASLLMIAGCGSAESSTNAGSSTVTAGDRDTDADSATAGSSATVCAAGASAHPVPAGFPSDFPLPPGMIVTAAEDRGSAGVVLTGVSDQPFIQTLHSLQQQLPAHGYTLTDGESEPRDAESDWSSASYQGRWAIRVAAGCPDDTAIQLLAKHR